MILSNPISGRILSIESSPALQQKLIDYLEDSGFILFSAKTQEEGLEIFRKEKPDLILSATPGLELLSILNRESPDTAVIIISDQNAVSNAVDALRLGAWDYMLKPIADFTLLERSICKALERTRLIEENKAYRKALELANKTLSDNLKTLESDQEAGRQVQMQLSPPEVHTFGAYTLEYKLLPSLYLSGDFIDYFKIDENLFGFYIADVSGHGASSAFVTVLLKSFIVQMKKQPVITQPHVILKMLSDDLVKAHLGKYLTMIYGVIDTRNNTLEYSIGGHYPKPILYDGKKAQYLEGEGFAVGIFEGATYEKYHVALPPAFSLIMYSDGILEILPNDDVDENEGVLLEKSSDPTLSSSTILDRFGLQKEASDRLPDDIAFLVLKYGNEKKYEYN